MARRNIKLTGRRDIKHNAFGLDGRKLDEDGILVLSFNDNSIQEDFPGDAKLKVHLTENKMHEVVDFGTVRNPKTSSQVENKLFAIPSTTMRIVGERDGVLGILLGSSSSKKVRINSMDGGSDVSKGILLFQPADIGRRLWKIDTSDTNDFPVLYVSESILDAATWAKNDPVFLGCVLPTVLEHVFKEIFGQCNSADDDGPQWTKAWLDWAVAILPGEKPPFDEDKNDRWIDDVVDVFLNKHNIQDSALNFITKEE